MIKILFLWVMLGERKDILKKWYLRISTLYGEGMPNGH